MQPILLCRVKLFPEPFRFSRGIQDPEHSPCQVALDAAADLPFAFAFGTTFLDVVAGLGVVGHSGQGCSV